jgi:CheY-like chemotaxis protein
VSRQAQILLVDDRSENLVALEAILSSLNQILVPVRSGEQALQALLTGEFAVILLDIVMPGMDGFETAARIKRQARTRSTTWPSRSIPGCSSPRCRSSSTST